MRKFLIALAAGLMAVSAVPAAASPAPQERPYSAGPMQGHGTMNHGTMNPGDDRWGHWDSSWGPRPSAPPRHWTRANDWHRHARACQVRYRSYNAHTDMFMVRHGVARRCRL